jgi:hypothetical protein
LWGCISGVFVVIATHFLHSYIQYPWHQPPPVHQWL